MFCLLVRLVRYVRVICELELQPLEKIFDSEQSRVFFVMNRLMKQVLEQFDEEAFRPIDKISIQRVNSISF